MVGVIPATEITTGGDVSRGVRCLFSGTIYLIEQPSTTMIRGRDRPVLSPSVLSEGVRALEEVLGSDESGVPTDSYPVAAQLAFERMSAAADNSGSASSGATMTDKPLPQDEPGAEERFDRGIKNALATKPTPHKPHSSEPKRKRNPNAHRPPDD